MRFSAETGMRLAQEMRVAKFRETGNETGIVGRRLEEEFCAELDRSRTVSVDWMVKGTAGATASLACAVAAIARRIRGAAIAADHVVGVVNAVGIENSELRVIEDVECLRAEFA